ncbi:MAG: T9SS type A sorting domain-containing protein, partial [Bacteroidota bacterium]
LDSYRGCCLYNNTKFNHCYAPNGSLYVYACGEDTVNNKAVVMQIHFQALNYQFLYIGATGTSLNNINRTLNNNYAVGKNGLIIKFNQNTTGVIVPSSFTQDLLSVNFYGNAISLGAKDYVLLGTISSSGIVLTVQNHTPGITYEEIHRFTASVMFRAAGENYFDVNLNGNQSAIYDYDFGPLNAAALYYFNGLQFVATDHGIYRSESGSTHTILELQPSSQGYSLNDFYSFSSTLYVCGQNGKLLQTTNNGGVPIPYISIVGSGKCVNTPHLFNVKSTSSTICNWFINNVPQSGTCNSMNYTFTSSGSYQIKYIGSNSSGIDSSIITIHVVDIPEIDYSFVFADSTLCHKEPLEITFDTSQAYVRYVLFNSGLTQSFGNSNPGNNGPLYFLTDSLSVGGNYRIQAQSTLAVCKANFTNPVFINIEQTKADFHHGLFNAYVNENVEFFEQCKDEDNYMWSFGPNSSISSSTILDPIVSFASPGQTQVKLICWSNAGCFDSIQTSGPTIVNSSISSDSCWYNNNIGVDLPWSGFYYPDIYDLKEVSDGYIISGTYNKIEYGTQLGSTYYDDSIGAYMMKYDYNGMLRWIIKSPGYSATSYKCLGIDSQQNIYATCSIGNSVIDNEGDIHANIGAYAIIKFDSKGKFLWANYSYGWRPEQICLDNSDNAIVGYNMANQTSVNNNKLYRNGVLIDTLDKSQTFRNGGIAKFDPLGNLMWDVPIGTTNSSAVISRQIKTNSNNDIFIAGEYNSSFNVVSTNGTNTAVPALLVPISVDGMHMLKFNSQGVLQWVVRSKGVTEDMELDSYGNCYLTGRYGSYNPSSLYTFYNSNGTTTSTGTTPLNQIAMLFAVKIDNNGICKWINVTQDGHSSAGYELDIKNDTIYIAGNAENQSSIIPTKLVNSDGSIFILEMNMSDFFIAVYDTNGYVHRVFKSGVNPYIISHQKFPGLFKFGDAYYIGLNSKFSYQSSNFVLFGDTIPYLNGYDGLVSKFYESCGINIPVEYEIKIDTNVCVGSIFTFPNGNSQVINGQVIDTVWLQTSIGLDSLVITKVTAVNSTTSFQNISSCVPIPSPSGNVMYAISGTYTDTILNYLGCDSIITTVFNLGSSFSPNIVFTICDSILSPSGLYYWSTDGVYTDTIQNSNGCDSIIIATVNVLGNTFSQNLSFTACDSILSPSGLHYWSSDGIYNDTIQNVNGCDSIISATVNILSSSISILYISSCQEYVSPSGNYIWNTTGVYSDIITNAIGCDSIITINLQIDEISTIVNQVTPTILSVNPQPGSFQWLDCYNGMMPISAATSQIYTATVNGSYAVEISNGTCLDTSACYTVNSLGVNKRDILSFQIIPNPATDYFEIIHNFKELISIELFDALGRQVGYWKNIKNGQKIDLSYLKSGVYTVRINDEKSGNTILIKM